MNIKILIHSKSVLNYRRKFQSMYGEKNKNHGIQEREWINRQSEFNCLKLATKI